MKDQTSWINREYEPGTETGLETGLGKEPRYGRDMGEPRLDFTEVKRAAGNSLIPGAVAAIAVCSTVSLLGRWDTGSAVAPINASSHVMWGAKAGQVERLTWAQTAPGLAVNVGASLWWAFVFNILFGKNLASKGWAGAVASGTATATLAYLVDYKLMPKRLTPGWEQRLSGRSLFLSLGAMGVGMGVGAMLMRGLRRSSRQH